MKWFVVAVVLLMMTLAISPAFADDLTVVSLNSAWQQVPNSPFGHFTWVLPSSIPGCGSENNTTCEPVGHFQFNQPGLGFNEYLHFDDCFTGDCPSDYILFGNNPNNGNLEIYFFSDPFGTDFPGVDPFTGTITLNGVVYIDGIGGALCFEDAVTGCPPLGVGIPDFPGLTVTLGSDGEASWDPFGYGHDTSDGISFNLPSPVPEPASMLLLGTGLVGLLRKRFTA